MIKRNSSKILLILLLSMFSSAASAHDIEVANADGKTIYYVKTSDTEVAVSFRFDSYYKDADGNTDASALRLPQNTRINGGTFNCNISNSAIA